MKIRVAEWRYIATGVEKMIKIAILSMCLAISSLALNLAAGSAHAAPRAQTDLVEFEKMTWVEVKSALAAGKTTALIYTGGVEERGPQNANGDHNLIAHATVEAIARELGNAIFLPVFPYTPNDAEPIPGTIGITNELLAAMLERITEQAFLNGFRNVILMGDHAGGQPQVYEEVANKLNARYGALRVFYCDQVYRPANDAFDQYLAQHGYPPGLHGYLFDTSEMMYLDKDNTCVRADLVSSAVGDPSKTPGRASYRTIDQICKKGSAHDERDVSEAEKTRVYQAYGISKCGGYCSGKRGCEIDHLISLEIGGANTEDNLWPQPFDYNWNAHDKDRLENKLHVLVCNGSISLDEAQTAVKTDWVAAYKKYVRERKPFAPVVRCKQ
jgi:creatinine amidohydrolase